MSKLHYGVPGDVSSPWARRKCFRPAPATPRKPGDLSYQHHQPYRRESRPRKMENPNAQHPLRRDSVQSF